MSTLLALPVVLPLAGAAVSLLLRKRLVLQRAVGIGVLGAVALISAVLLVGTERDGTVVAEVGAWAPPAGIVLVGDLLALLLLLVSAITVLVVYVYAIGQHDPDELSPWFHPVYLVLMAGASLSFLTGDLFNLFVAVEVTLAASYVLVTLGGRPPQVRTGMTYVVMNLLGSMLFLAAVGLIYAATGSVNLAELVERVGDLPPGLRGALGLLLLVAFGLKAAVFPLFSWLPDSYPTAAAPVTAVFAGLLTKIGVYAIIRTQVLLFHPDGRPSAVILWIAGLTMVVGVLGAVAQDDIRRILSFHIVSQIGYMVMGVGLFSLFGVAAAIFYLFHQIPVKTALFLAGGIVERLTGTASLDRLGGLARRAPLLGALFLLPALSLSGIPPFAGFVGKLSLVQAGLALDHWWVVAASLVAGLLTLYSMTKIWNGAFWGVPEEEPPVVAARGDGPLVLPRLMTISTSALVLVVVGLAVLAGPLWDLCERAAADIVEPARYVDAVLGR